MCAEFIVIVLAPRPATWSVRHPWIHASQLTMTVFDTDAGYYSITSGSTIKILSTRGQKFSINAIGSWTLATYMSIGRGSKVATCLDKRIERSVIRNIERTIRPSNLW